MSMTFSGQVAVVTGAANGIGRATAQAFAAEGLKVVVADLDTAGGEGTVALIRTAGGEATFVRCNVTLESDVKNLMDEVVNTYGRLDYAFNNAGIEIEKGKLAEGTLDEMCDNAAKSPGSNPLKHIAQPRHGTVKKPAQVRVFSCLLYTSPSPRDRQKSRMPSSA